MMLLALAGCGGKPVAPVIDPTDPSARQRKAPRYHVVRKGETLYSISWRYGFDYRVVARWNGIGRPYTIYPGQRLRLFPKTSTRTAAANKKRRTARKQSAPKEPAPTQARSEPARESPPANRTDEHEGDRAVSKWIWPAQGKLIGTFNGNDASRKGIDIGGRAGQTVIASASGEVVYSGSGLIRYGKLIIIKHNHTYFSAYAHNRKLLVKEGDRVKAGQGIAEMGSTGIDRTMLHFEIRRNGKPVDPLRYLPKR